jgi:hypothetical protein
MRSSLSRKSAGVISGGSFSYVNYVMFVVRCLSRSILGWTLRLFHGYQLPATMSSVLQFLFILLKLFFD